MEGAPKRRWGPRSFLWLKRGTGGKVFEGAMGGGEGGTGLPVGGRGGGSGQEFLCLLTTWPLPTSPQSAK